MKRSTIVALGTAALLAAPAVPALADSSGTVVDTDVASVGSTSAGSNNASATPVQVLEEDLDSTSAQEGSGANGGALVDTGESDDARAQAAPSSASVDGGSSSAYAALAAASFGDDLELEVASSEAESTDGASSSTATNGAVVRIGGEEIRILHSKATSDGGSTSYVIGHGDDGYVSSSDAGSSCEIDLGPLGSIACLRADGGGAGDGDGTGDTAAAGGSSADLARGELVDQGFRVLSASAAPAGPAQVGPPNGGSDAGDADDDDVADAGATNGGDALPRTGSDLVRTVAYALALVAGGAVLRRQRRDDFVTTHA